MFLIYYLKKAMGFAFNRSYELMTPVCQCKLYTGVINVCIFEYAYFNYLTLVPSALGKQSKTSSAHSPSVAFSHVPDEIISRKKNSIVLPAINMSFSAMTNKGRPLVSENEL
jgi:hypothetical protein